MMLESAESISGYLHVNKNFQDCILEDVRWHHYGTVIELVIDYIWLPDGSIRAEFAPKKLKRLILHTVQEFHLVNALNESVALYPEAVDWGLSEMGDIRLIDDEAVLRRYSVLPLPFHHLQCGWDRPRRLDIVFSTLKALEGS